MSQEASTFRVIRTILRPSSATSRPCGSRIYIIVEERAFQRRRTFSSCRQLPGRHTTTDSTTFSCCDSWRDGDAALRGPIFNKNAPRTVSIPRSFRNTKRGRLISNFAELFQFFSCSPCSSSHGVFNAGVMINVCQRICSTSLRRLITQARRATARATRSPAATHSAACYLRFMSLTSDSEAIQSRGTERKP